MIMLLRIAALQSKTTFARLDIMDLNQKKGKGNTLTSAKAWAWNCMNRPKETSKIIILVDYDENESELQPVLDILNAVADDVINIHDGFEKAIQKIMDNVS